MVDFNDVLGAGVPKFHGIKAVNLCLFFLWLIAVYVCEHTR